MQHNVTTCNSAVNHGKVARWMKMVRQVGYVRNEGVTLKWYTNMHAKLFGMVTYLGTFLSCNSDVNFNSGREGGC